MLKLRRFGGEMVNLRDLFPDDNIPNFNTSVCISDIGHFVSPIRTSKHKKYNLKNFHLSPLGSILPSHVSSSNFNPILKLSDIMEPIKECKKNLNLLPDFNPRVALNDIMFAPVEPEEEDICSSFSDLNNDGYRVRFYYTV